MKKFVFRLKVVLDRAVKEEERLTKQLAQLRTELMRKEDEINGVSAQRLDLLARMTAMQQGTFQAHDLQGGHLHLEALGNDLLSLFTQRKEIEQRIVQKQVDVTEAVKKRQMMEKLRDKQYAAYQKEAERQEFQGMEETVLPRLTRQRTLERVRLEQAQQMGAER